MCVSADLQLFCLVHKNKTFTKAKILFSIQKKQNTATETKLCAKIKVDSPKFLITSGQKVNINGR